MIIGLMNGKGCERKRSLSILKYGNSICHDKNKNRYEKCGQDNRSSSISNSWIDSRQSNVQRVMTYKLQDGRFIIFKA
jgi:hypothetical protein